MGLAIRRNLHENVVVITLGLAITIIAIGLTIIITTRPTLATLATLNLQQQ